MRHRRRPTRRPTAISWRCAIGRIIRASASPPPASDTDYPLAYAKTPGELQFYVRYLQESGFAEVDERNRCRVLVPGWLRANDLAVAGAESRSCFVAMWFGEPVIEAYERGIAPAIEEAGYSPIRIHSY